MVNSKKLRRLMREHDLQPKRRRRYVVTTDSDHAGPIFPDLARTSSPSLPISYGCGPDLCRHIQRLRLISPPSLTPGRARSSATRLAIHGRPHRRGCAESSHSEPRLQKVASNPTESQYASENRSLLVTHGLTGSMSRRGNPYDNAKAESFMKTLKVEAVSLAGYESSRASRPTSHASWMRCTI